MGFLSRLSTEHYRWLAGFWTIAIVAACSIPAASLSPLGPALSADKAIHAGLFAAFGTLWMRTVCPPRDESPGLFRRQALRVLGAGALFAVGTEFYQHLLPLKRTADPYDALANGIGLLLSVITYGVFYRMGRKVDESRR
ncbi:MAG: hypothetical protein BRD35_00205 [Bacteroidetes bacterium QH_7_62_13]|nr:MAG: hypothetical protein BRD35_00205 [Bacteroidetes bacterium QH_7_62_13]